MYNTISDSNPSVVEKLNRLIDLEKRMCVINELLLPKDEISLDLHNALCNYNKKELC